MVSPGFNKLTSCTILVDNDSIQCQNLWLLFDIFLCNEYIDLSLFMVAKPAINKLINLGHFSFQLDVQN